MLEETTVLFVLKCSQDDLLAALSEMPSKFARSLPAHTENHNHVPVVPFEQQFNETGRHESNAAKHCMATPTCQQAERNEGWQIIFYRTSTPFTSCNQARYQNAQHCSKSKNMILKAVISLNPV